MLCFPADLPCFPGFLCISSFFCQLSWCMAAQPVQPRRSLLPQPALHLAHLLLWGTWPGLWVCVCTRLSDLSRAQWTPCSPLSLWPRHLEHWVEVLQAPLPARFKTSSRCHPPLPSQEPKLRSFCLGRWRASLRPTGPPFTCTHPQLYFPSKLLQSARPSWRTAETSSDCSTNHWEKETLRLTWSSSMAGLKLDLVGWMEHLWRQKSRPRPEPWYWPMPCALKVSTNSAR